MNKNIFITRKIPEIGIKMLVEKGYNVDIYPKENPPTQKEIIKYLKKKPYDAVISLLTDKIDSKIFDIAKSVKIYANYAVGFDNIDTEEAKKRGIIATNTPGSFSNCIAEQTMAFILGLTTRMVEADDFMRAGKYKGWSPMNFMGTDLKGKTLGLIGAGHIGGLVACQAQRGFGVRVIYYDVARNEQIEKECNAEFFPTVEEVLKQSDIVSLHVPLLPSTKHLINENNLKLMKPSSFLINTSRGPIVDEVALVKALQNGTIKGAGLDVFEFEPKLAKGLSKLPNVILTPHISSARQSARNEMATIAAQNVIDFFENGKPKNQVN
ncbi:MAG: D-glycerate dehydrogenase [Candidatus Paceibacterota bacterium]